MSDMAEFKERVTFAHRVREMGKNATMRIGGLIAVGGTAIVGTASAAVDFSNISSLIQAVTGLMPDLIDLVIAVAPLVITLVIIEFFTGFFRNLLNKL